VGNEQHERITGDRKKVEGEEGAAMPPAVDEHATRIGIDGAEQSSQPVKKADDKNGRAEGLEIFRDEAHPKLFAHPDNEDGDKQDDEIALEPEEVRGPAPEAHERWMR
jgi:hypothetical protein